MTASLQWTSGNLGPDTLGHDFRSQGQVRRMWGFAVVVGLHLLVGWLLLSGTARKGLAVLKKPMEAVVIQEVIIPPAPPPPPKEIRPPQPTQPNPMVPVPVVQPDVPVLEAQRPMETLSPPPPVAEKPVIPQVQPVAPVAAPPDTSKAQVASMEADYVARVRAMLNSTKRYPTGRQASQQRPQGRVKVWFSLARGGALLDSGVMESSNSNLLDDAALAAVRRGTYPSFPNDTWPGEAQHKFSAEIEFLPPSSG
jgi:protein TonB